VLPHQLHQRRPAQRVAIAQVCALSIHISGVSITNRLSVPRFSATCSALIVSSRQSGIARVVRLADAVTSRFSPRRYATAAA
jgi:hypothetical protein